MACPTSAWRARRQRGVPRAPNPPCRRPQDHGKNHPHTERGQSREKPSRGGPEECALQEVKAEGSSAPRSWGAWAHSKAVTPDPSSFPATSGLTPRPLPSAAPTFAEDLPPHISPLSQNALCSPSSRLSLRHHTQHSPRRFCCYGRGFATAIQLLHSFLTSRPSNLLIISVLCSEFPPTCRHPFWLLRF